MKLGGPFFFLIGKAYEMERGGELEGTDESINLLLMHQLATRNIIM